MFWVHWLFPGTSVIPPNLQIGPVTKTVPGMALWIVGGQLTLLPMIQPSRAGPTSEFIASGDKREGDQTLGICRVRGCVVLKRKSLERIKLFIANLNFTS